MVKKAFGVSVPSVQETPALQRWSGEAALLGAGFPGHTAKLDINAYTTSLLGQQTLVGIAMFSKSDVLKVKSSRLQ